MRIGVLTSSRADFGIYLPLLKELKNDDGFELKIIAFGTHLSPFHGETVKQIVDSGFEVNYQIESMLITDSPNAISSAIGLTTLKFSDFWKEHGHQFDLIFCLGDRYEMFAAVLAGVPYQLSFAHIHGGETTLGAIDNVFRHAITLASQLHFVSTEAYSERVAELIESNEGIYHVGALSLDSIGKLSLLSIDQFKAKWGIDLSEKTILVTFHPETVAYKDNAQYVKELIDAILELDGYQILITMPNADTAGNIIREAFIANLSNLSNVFIVENLGTQSYFTAMKYAALLLGNTSSGIIEAASFGKYVIDLGNRQKGRTASGNVFNCPITKTDILQLIKKIESMPSWGNDNIYFNGGAAENIIKVLRSKKY